MTFRCRSCGADLKPDELVVLPVDAGELLVCPRCDVDCRCPQEGGTTRDPIEQMDDHQGDRGRVRGLVLQGLEFVPWNGELTVGDLKSERCTASRVGNRCERLKGHHGPHHSGEWSWAGKAMYA